MTRLCYAFFLICILAGCAGTNLPPVSTAGFTLEEDEKRLWARSKEEATAIDQSDMIYDDRELEAYLNEVARKLQPPQVMKAVPFKVEVIRNPLLNAFAYPHGAVYVHSGILAQMENEAQLATLLAHEMTHATHRHAIKEFRHVKSKSAYLATLSTTLGGAPLIGEVFNILGAVGTMASVSGYSSDLETQADMEGLQLVVKAGYDPREAIKIFAELKKELEEEEVTEPFFFGTHPRINERIRNYQKLLRTEYAGRNNGVKNESTFRGKIAKVILDNAGLNLKAGRYSKAFHGAEKYLTIRPNDHRGHFLLAEAHRQRGENDDMEKAMAAYRKAVAIDVRHSESYRGMGLLQLKKGDAAAAKKNLRQYLNLMPQATDREYIEEYLKQM